MPLEDDDSLEDDVPLDDDDAAEGWLVEVVAAELAPIDPVAAMMPNASTKVASAAAAILRRIFLIRAARACMRSRTALEVEFWGMAGR